MWWGCWRSGTPKPPQEATDKQLIDQLGRHPRASGSFSDGAHLDGSPFNRRIAGRQYVEAARRLAAGPQHLVDLSAVDHLHSAGTYFLAAAEHMSRRDEASAADCLRLAEAHRRHALGNRTE